MLTAIETTATIGKNRHLIILNEDLPESSSSNVRVIVPFEEDDFDETEWQAAALKNEVFDFLNDGTEDIYTLEDSKPVG